MVCHSTDTYNSSVCKKSQIFYKVFVKLVCELFWCKPTPPGFILYSPISKSNFFFFFLLHSLLLCSVL